MKRVFAFLTITLFMLIGCTPKPLTLPEEAGSYLLISHLKEPSLSFMQVDDYKIDHTEPLSSSWGTQVSLSDGRIAALTNDSSKIELLNLENGMVNPLIELDYQASTMIYDAETELLIVSSEEQMSISFISTETGQEVNKVQLTESPTELLLDRSGNVFVLSTEASKVDYIDLDSGAIKQSFTVTERPAGLFFDGELLWTGGHGPTGELNKQINGYEINDGKLSETIDVGLMPIAITGTLDDSSFYVLCHGNDHLYQIDVQSKEIVASIEVGHNPNFMYEYNEHLFISNFDSDSLSIITKEPFALMAEVEVEPGPYAISSGEVKE